MFRFSRSGKGEVDLYRFMSNIVQIIICFFCHMPCNTLPLVVNHCSKHSKPLGTPSKLVQILGDGYCLFRALSYAVTGRQIYYTQVRGQIINHMNSSLDSYLVRVQMARNIIRVKGIEILSASSLLSTDFFVYTRFGDTHKWQMENRDPRKLTPVRVFNINCKSLTPSLNSS